MEPTVDYLADHTLLLALPAFAPAVVVVGVVVYIAMRDRRGRHDDAEDSSGRDDDWQAPGSDGGHGDRGRLWRRLRHDRRSPTTVGPSDMPNAQAPPPAQLVIDITIAGGGVTPTNAQLEATVGEPIVLRVDSDAADQLHIHSIPEHTFDVEPRAGQSFEFSVDVPGRVDVELHELDRTIATIRCGDHRSARRGPDTRSRRFHRSPDPVHLRAHRGGVGADVHVRGRGVRLATPAVRPGGARTPVAATADRGDRCAARPDGSAAAAALLFAVWVAVAAFLGPQNDENPLPGVFYVLLWVGLVAVSLAVGPVWRAISPVRTVYRLLRPGRAASARRLPERWGYWPAVIGLFAFVWLELASPDPGIGGGDQDLAADLPRASPWPARSGAVTAGSPGPIRSRCTAWSPRGCRRCAAGAEDGRIVIGNPFDHLLSMPVRPGTVAVLAVLLGSTAFDSFSAMPLWRTFVDQRRGGALVSPSRPLLRTAGLLVFAAVVAATFWLAARATGGVDGNDAGSCRDSWRTH